MGFGKKAVAAALAFSLVGVPAFALSACGAADNRPVVGTVAEGNLDLGLVNGLSSDITALSVRASGTEEWPESLLAADAKVAANEEARLCIAPIEGATSYDLRVVTDSGSLEFIEVPLADAAKMTLCSDGELAYVDYTDAEGNEASTKEAAEARKKAEEEAARKAAEDAAAAKAVDELIAALGEVTLDSKDATAAARTAYDALTDEQKALVTGAETLTAAEARIAELEAEAAAAAEAEAAAAAEAESYYYDDSYSYDTSYTYYEAPVQTQDTCVPDPVFRN